MRRLQIVEPCHETWDTLEPGSDPTRRACAACSKEVVHLSSLTEEEAHRVLDGAARETARVRIDHDPQGRVLLRGKGGAVVLGASLLLAACGHGGSNANQDAGTRADPAALNHAAGGAATDPARCGGDAGAGAVAAAAPPDAGPHRSTLGCVCVQGDPLCSCL